MLIFAAILAIFVYGMIAAMLGTILPDLSERFRLTPRQNGTIAFAQALGLMIASLAVGPLLDNEGDKIGLLLGLAFIAIALIGLPRSRGFGSIVVLLFLLGVGGGIVVTGANALTSGVSETHRATALNLVNLFFGLGGLATPFIVANLFNRNWVAALLHHRGPDRGDGDGAVVGGHARAGSGVGLCPHPGRVHPRPTAPVPAGFVPLPLHFLRGGGVELAGAAPCGPGHSGT